MFCVYRSLFLVAIQKKFPFCSGWPEPTFWQKKELEGVAYLVSRAKKFDAWLKTRGWRPPNVKGPRPRGAAALRRPAGTARGKAGRPKAVRRPAKKAWTAGQESKNLGPACVWGAAWGRKKHGFQRVEEATCCLLLFWIWKSAPSSYGVKTPNYMAWWL